MGNGRWLCMIEQSDRRSFLKHHTDDGLAGEHLHRRVMLYVRRRLYRLMR